MKFLSVTTSRRVTAGKEIKPEGTEVSGTAAAARALDRPCTRSPPRGAGTSLVVNVRLRHRINRNVAFENRRRRPDAASYPQSKDELVFSQPVGRS